MSVDQSSSNNVDGIEALKHRPSDDADTTSSSLQVRLAYNQETMADNGKVMSRLFKKMLRQRHGYCIDCPGPPVRLYETVVLDNNLTTLKKFKLGNAQSIVGECEGGNCLKCHPDGIITKKPQTQIKDDDDDHGDIKGGWDDSSSQNNDKPPKEEEEITDNLVGTNEEGNNDMSVSSDSTITPVTQSSNSDLKKKPTSSTFPKEGIRFSYILNEFCKNHSLDGLSTAQVCDTIIKPATSEYQCSFCHLLQRTNHSAYGAKASLFVSHAHKYLFLDLINALECHLREDEMDTIIWLDLFSINQHQPMDWTFDWLSTTFKTAIHDMGRTIMVMSPWNDPIPFTRTWCVFEAYCTCTGSTQSKFEIALCEKDRQQFLEDVIADPQQRIDEMLSNIRAEKSTCSIESDRRQIFLVIHQSVGFSSISEMVFGTYRDWVVQVPLVEALNQCQEEKQELIMKRTLGMLYLGQGKYNDAEALLNDAYQKQSEILGNDHPDTQKTALGLVELFIELGKYSQSMELLSDIFKVPVLSDAGVFSSAQVDECAAATDNLCALELHALLRSHRGEDEVAFSLYNTCWKRRREALGDHHPLTLQAMSASSAIRSPTSRLLPHKTFTSLLSECFEQQKGVMGEKHPQTLATMHRLADAYLGDKSDEWSYTEEAKRLHELCLKRRTAILGASHPKTLQSMASLARLYHLQQSKNAEWLMEDCWRKRRTALGNWHPDTQAICDRLANIFIAQKKLRKAQSLYNVCANEVSPDMLAVAMESAEQLFHKKEHYGDYLRLVGRSVMIKKILLGILNLDTLRSMVDLGLLYKAAGRLHAALSLLEPALAIQKQTLGDDHEETIGTTIHLSVLLKARGDRKEAEIILETLLDKAKAKVGMDHPLVLQIMYELGRHSINEISKKLLIDCHARRKYLLGADHVDTLDALFHLGQLYKLNNLKELAMECYEECFEKGSKKLTYALALVDLYRHFGRIEDHKRMQDEIRRLKSLPLAVPWHEWFRSQKTFGEGCQLKESILYDPLYDPTKVDNIEGNT